MDPLSLLDHLRADYPKMSAFALILGGSGLGWLIAWVILRERLAHYRERIDHYKDLLGERIKSPGNNPLPAPPSPKPQKTISSQPAKNLPEKKQFIDVNAKFLIDMYEERTSYHAEQLTRPYFGKWMRIKAKIDNISRTYSDRDDLTIVGKDEKNGMILATFASNLEAVRSLKKSEQIEIVGKIANVTELFVSLSDCEIVSPSV
jgi:hypothetical protein